ncbi:MAG: hypothetical protein GKS00_07130 [Alphaproteobacteria bacterium]|nr:hypothetical protein [Alphaproteobacteria bacterium]
MAMTENSDKRRYPSEVHKRQRSKNLTMLAVLVGLVVLFYAVSIIRMSFE